MPKINRGTLRTLLTFKMREKPESACVADISYDPETQDMTVEFQERGTYVYHEVPLGDYVDFQSAGSQGTYFNLYIRPKFSYERIS